MFVGIDVHKHTHAAALVDERGGERGVLTFPNSPAGYQRLIGWLADRDAAQAVIGVESPGSYGRCLVGALAAAGHEVLHVPAWRTHRERRRQGPGKTDPGDALAVADVVRRKRAELGPALQPELVRAISMLELQRRRFVLDRTQAIQRLRSDWTQIDPVAEAKVAHVDRQRELRRLKRISFGDGLAERIAATTIRQLARDIEDLNGRIAELEGEIAALLEQHGNPRRGPARRRQPNRRRPDLPGRRCSPLQGRRGVRALLRHGTDPLRLRADRRPPPTAPRRQPPTQRGALSHRDRPTTPPPRRQGVPRPQDPRRQNPTRGPPRAQTPPHQRRLPPPARLGRRHTRHEPLDIGESSASIRPWAANGPTAAATPQARTEPASWQTGSSTTTTGDRTQRSVTGHRSAAFTTSRGRTAR